MIYVQFLQSDLVSYLVQEAHHSMGMMPSKYHLLRRNPVTIARQSFPVLMLELVSVMGIFSAHQPALEIY